MFTPKILFTTTYISPDSFYDPVSTSRPEGRKFDIKAPRKISYGLRFIRENIPFIEILEYPTREEYLSILREGWDIVGFSFYINEIHEIKKMVEDARKAGVEEVWGGNYGVLTDGIGPIFDKIFIGNAEREIANYLGYKIDEIKHPPLAKYLYAPGGITIQRYGALFTSRGCPFSCSFCQTPVFSNKIIRINFHNIEEVLKQYNKLGIRDVQILDESFGLSKKYTEKIIDLLGKYEINWIAQVRLEDIPDNLSWWMSNGFTGAIIGIESLNQSNLDAVNKRRSVDFTLDKICMLKNHNRYVLGNYMIGYERDTTDSIKRDIKKLAELRLDIVPLYILTPLPKTPLYNYIDEKYGIVENDYHKYNTRNLVWNHPNITPDEMKELLEWGVKTLRSPMWPMVASFRMLRRYLQDMGPFKGINYLMDQFIDTNFRPRYIQRRPYSKDR